MEGGSLLLALCGPAVLRWEQALGAWDLEGWEGHRVLFVTKVNRQLGIQDIMGIDFQDVPIF